MCLFVRCCDAACCHCRDAGQHRPPRHIKTATTMNDVLLSVGVRYAFCRQFIFLSNALLIGCSMALFAAGVQQERTSIGQWMGSAWYQTIMGLAGSVFLTTLLGCIGAC